MYPVLQTPNKGPFNPSLQYTIRSQMDQGMAITFDQGGDKVCLQSLKQNQSQKFRILENNGRYMFLSATGKVLQVPDGSSTPGIKLKGNKRTENMNQIWEIEESKNGGYCIKSFSGSYLDAEGEKRSSGTSIIQWPKNGKKNQTWHIRPLKIEKKFSTDKLYEIVSALDKNMNLTVFRPDNPNSPDNKNLIIYQKNNKNNQKFKIVEHDDGSCQIICEDDSLAVLGNSQANGAQLKFIPHLSNNHKFKIEDPSFIGHNLGSCAIKTFCGKYLHIEKCAKRAPVIQIDEVNKPNQTWYIRPFVQEKEEKTHQVPNKKKFKSDQYYHIVSAVDKGMTFEMKKPDDPNSEEKDKLIINSVDHNKKNQKMRIIEQENGFCEIVCEQKSLHAPGNEKNSGLQLKFKNQNENNQRFAIVPSMDYPNAYLIKTSYEKFFEVLSGKTQKKTPVIQNDYHKQASQMWYIQQTQPPKHKNHAKQFDEKVVYHFISALNKEKAVELWKPDDPKSQNKDKLILANFNSNHKNQKFMIKEHDNGECEIICQQKYITVSDNSHNNGIQMKAIQEKTNQRCHIIRSNNYPNGFFIQTFCGKFMEVLDGKTQARTPIVQNKESKLDNQLWFIQPI